MNSGIGYIVATAMVIAASVLCPEASFVTIAILPIVRMATAFVGLGYAVLKLSPLLFAKSLDATTSDTAPSRRVELSIGEFCLWFVPATVLLLALVTAAVGFSGILRGESILIVVAGLTIVAEWLLPRKKIKLTLPCPEWRVLVLLLPAGVAIIAGLAVFLPFTPGQWDALTYHLFIPARWVQEGGIFHVPTVFGDPAPAFAPGNAMTFYGGLLALLGSDSLMNCQAVVFQCLTALAVYKLARFFGGGTVGAAVAGVMALVAPVIFFPSFSAYTDVMAQALLLTGVWWLARYIREPLPGHAGIAAMCCGLALGTKTVMVIFSLPFLLILILLLIFRRCWRDLAISAAIVIVSGGWWYFRNLALYGNPVFPAEVKIFDMVVFEGLLPIETLRGGPFHVGDMRQLWSGVISHFGVVAFALMPLGLAGWVLLLTRNLIAVLPAGVRDAASDAESRRSGSGYVSPAFPAAVAVIVLLLTWTASYCWVVPFNNQYRFLLGVWLLCLPGLAFLFTRIRVPVLGKTENFGLDKLNFKLYRTLAWVGAMLAMLSMLFTIFRNLCHIAAGLPMLPLITLATLLAIAAGLLLWYVYRPAKPRLILTVSVIVLTLVINEAVAPGLRVATLVKSNAGAFEPAFRLFNQYDYALPPATIAYTGANVPYIFVGTRLKNRVVYCNIAGDYGEGCHEFWWRQGKRHYRHERPRPYQVGANPESWLRNLERAGAQVLAVMYLHPAEQGLHYMTEEGFPPEAAWAESLPEVFDPLVLTPLVRVYLIDRDKLARKARLSAAVYSTKTVEDG